MKIVTIGRTIGHTARHSHKFHINVTKIYEPHLKKKYIIYIYILYCVIFFHYFQYKTLRSKNGISGSVLQIPVSILKPAITGSY